MLGSTVTSKGQVTIPAALRRRLGLKEGDRVEFVEEDGRVTVRRVENNVESAFGLVRAHKTVSLEAVEATIRARGAG
jgi:AbrB family looped-hinge helix DNA binding protein